MVQPAPPQTQVAGRPAPQRLASAKLALLQDAQPVRHASAAPSGAQTAGHAVMDAIREKPLIAAGGAALLGFFLVRKNFFFKIILTKVFARLGMNAIRQILK